MPGAQRTRGSPAYRRHKRTGKAIVTLNHAGGRRQDVVLGDYGSPESRRKYHRVLAEWDERGRLPEPPPAAAEMITVGELIVRFWEGHVVSYYRRPDGTPTSEAENFRQALRSLKTLYADLPAREFGPLKLEAWLHAVTRPTRDVADPETGELRKARGWCRTNANKNLKRIQHLFKWGTKKELVPPHVYPAVLSVGGLRAGRCDARESEPVRAVAESFVEQVLPELPSAQLRAVARLQLLCGARPGELLALRGSEIVMRKINWFLKPKQHKNAHRGHERMILITPDAQSILKPFLKPDLNACLFSPAEAEAQRLAELAASRKTPADQGNRTGYGDASRAGRQPRKFGEHFSVAAYRRAVDRACARAFPPPAELARHDGETAQAWRSRLTPEQRRELAAWRKSHRWHPHQLRHTAGTRVHEEQGPEKARLFLGHRTISATRIYIEDTERGLEEVARDARSTRIG
jgi:integrase